MRSTAGSQFFKQSDTVYNVQKLYLNDPANNIPSLLRRSTSSHPRTPPRQPQINYLRPSFKELVQEVKKGLDSARHSPMRSTNDPPSQVALKQFNSLNPATTRKFTTKQNEEKVRANQEAERVARLQLLIRRELKDKQSRIKWKADREAARLKEIEEKKMLQDKLDHEWHVWKKEQQLKEEAKRREMAFRHSINMEKVQMLRSSKKKIVRKELAYLREQQVESWRNMKFKEENQRRVETARKKLQTAEGMRRTASARTKISSFK